MSYDDIRDRSLDYCCAQCGSEIVKKWNNDAEGYDWYCSKNSSHTGYRQKLSPQKALQRGEMDKVLGPGAQKDLEERAKRSETALSLLPKEDIATKRALGIAEIGELVLWAEKIGLVAQLGHVCLYHGKPYPTIDGYYYLNNKRDKPYRVWSAPMTSEERTAYMIEEEAYGYIAQATLDGELVPERGIGYVGSTELTEKSKKDPEQWRSPVVHDKPTLMADKRAKWQLLRQLIPLEVKE